MRGMKAQRGQERRLQISQINIMAYSPASAFRGFWGGPKPVWVQLLDLLVDVLAEGTAQHESGDIVDVADGARNE